MPHDRKNVDFVFFDGCHRDPDEPRSTIPARCWRGVQELFGQGVQVSSEDYRQLLEHRDEANRRDFLVQVLASHHSGDAIVVFGMPGTVAEAFEAWQVLEEKFGEEERPFITVAPLGPDKMPLEVVDVSDTETDHDYGEGKLWILQGIEREGNRVRTSWKPLRISEAATA